MNTDSKLSMRFISFYFIQNLIEECKVPDSSRYLSYSNTGNRTEGIASSAVISRGITVDDAKPSVRFPDGARIQTLIYYLYSKNLYK